MLFPLYFAYVLMPYLRSSTCLKYRLNRIRWRPQEEVILWNVSLQPSKINTKKPKITINIIHHSATCFFRLSVREGWDDFSSSFKTGGNFWCAENFVKYCFFGINWLITNSSLRWHVTKFPAILKNAGALKLCYNLTAGYKLSIKCDTYNNVFK